MKPKLTHDRMIDAMPRRSLEARNTFLWFVAGAILLGGLGQNVARLMARIVQGRPLDHGVHAWWMTPAGDALLLIPVATLLLMAGTQFTWARSASVRASALIFPLVLSGLLLIGRLHWVAQLLLAAGVSVRLGTWTASSNLTHHLRRAVTGLLAVSLVIAVPLAVWPLIREASDHRALANARPGAPNVLLLLWDTVRASSLSVYGNEHETTPLLARLASQGAVFDRAYATASYTLPSHASLFTGRWAHELSTNWRVPLDSSPTTLAEVFANAGYRTSAFSANRAYVTREFGLGRGFSHFEEHRLSFQHAVRSSTLARAIVSSDVFRDLIAFDDDLARVRAADSHEKLVRWLERDRGRPWFAFVNFMEAHTPYLPSEPFAYRFGWYREGATRAERRRVQVAARDEPEQVPPEVGRHARLAYEASIAELDSAVSAMLDDLRARGLLDNTMIIVAADHGEEFGEHDIFGHGNSLYVQSLHVPLIMVFPPRIPAVRVATAVSIRDVAATILDVTGTDAVMPGSSLRPLWEHAAGAARDPVFAEIRHDPRLPQSSRASTADLMSAIDDFMQVIRTGSDAFEAFDLALDPTGVVAADTSNPLFARLRALLPPPNVGQRLGTAGRAVSPGGMR